MYAWIALIFVVGYLCIALEHPLRIDKAASAILTAVLCWTLLAVGQDGILPAAALADGHGLSYTLRGSIVATPQERQQKSWDIQRESALSPVPGLPGALR